MKKTISEKTEKERMKKILRILKKEYPEAACSLKYNDPFQLLVATILSAQCTDARVNMVTPVLFSRFRTVEDMARADLNEIERIIRPTGFFKNKARAVSEVSRLLIARYGGTVPDKLEKLIQLRGVGRKTANVVLGNAYGIPALVVDTHVGRISCRMGFTKASEPVKIEFEMMKYVPKKDWTIYSHLLIFHGRKICLSRKAQCDKCSITELCSKVGINRKP